jgi:hypothetical protein
MKALRVLESQWDPICKKLVRPYLIIPQCSHGLLAAASFCNCANSRFAPAPCPPGGGLVLCGVCFRCPASFSSTISSTGANSGFGDYQWKSPFDTCPATMSPLSLTNLQIGIGGQNVLNSTLNMTYENFLEQVNLAEQLTSSDFGVSTGLISQGYWEQSKWYFVNVERGNIADKLQPRNINVSFNNNSNVPIDVIIFTFYSDQLTIDVETGIVTK